MDRNTVYGLLVVLFLNQIGATIQFCPGFKNCHCGGTLNFKVDCVINGHSVNIDILPGVYVNIICENITSLDYDDFPNRSNHLQNFKSVSFKNCPVPSTSFKNLFYSLGINKTMTLIFQNNGNISLNFQRKHFMGLDLTKLLISVNSDRFLPNNLFMDLSNLRWLNIRIKSFTITKILLEPLRKLDTLEISHNQMTNISSNVFEHLTYLRKLSLWQSNVSYVSQDLFSGMHSLEELDISSTSLLKIPQEIFYPLKNLKKVTLFSNRFSTVPQGLFSRSKLLNTIIILNNNVKLTNLPKLFLANLPYLKKVHIQRCGIENISYDVFLNSSVITNVSLAYNAISYLPDSVFNNQINLLELDLSFNNISTLGTILFSSLVKLEVLNLCDNSITEIYGATFSPLLSLKYLNIERNKLKTISSYLLENNKQKLSITLAFNELTFENKFVVNNSWMTNMNSPFVHTYNLRMLNLSHNKINTAFVDWWTNGHEKIDLSYNFINKLWPNKDDETSQSYKTAITAPSKEIWIGQNNLFKDCNNLWFLDLLQTRWKTKIIDIESTQVSTWSSRIACYAAFYTIIFVTALFLIIMLITMAVYVLYKNEINYILKNLCSRVFISSMEFQKNKEIQIALKYSTADEEFVLKEILPGLQICKDVKILMKPVSLVNKKTFFDKKKHENHVNITLVVFSPNYLMTTYSHVNIKKIRGEMLKAKNTIHIFVNTASDNSIYAFLKEQRDTQVSLLWREIDFWNRIYDILSNRTGTEKGSHKNKGNVHGCKSGEIKNLRCKFSQRPSLIKLSDWPHIDTFEKITHSQV